MDARELQAAIAARLERFKNASDPEDLLDPAGLRDAEVLVASGSGRPGWQAAGLLRYARHLVLPERERADELARSRAAFDRAGSDLPAARRELEEAAARPVRVPKDNRRAPVSLFGAGQPLPWVDDLIAHHRWRLRVRPADDPEYWTSRMELAEALELRYQRTQDLADLDAAIAAAREARATVPPGRATAPPYAASTLGLLLVKRFGASTDAGTGMSDLNAAIDAFRDAVATAVPGDRVYLTMHQGNLGQWLLGRHFAALADAGPGPGTADLDEAVDLLEKSLAGTDDEARSLRSHRLGEAYFMRFARDRSPDDLARSLEVGNAALSASTQGTEAAVERGLVLIPRYIARYQLTGDRDDIQQAARIAKWARKATPRGHPLRAAADQALGTLRATR
jgi:hypothetical protein